MAEGAAKEGAKLNQNGRCALEGCGETTRHGFLEKSSSATEAVSFTAAATSQMRARVRNENNKHGDAIREFPSAVVSRPRRDCDTLRADRK